MKLSRRTKIYLTIIIGLLILLFVNYKLFKGEGKAKIEKVDQTK